MVLRLKRRSFARWPRKSARSWCPAGGFALLASPLTPRSSLLADSASLQIAGQRRRRHFAQPLQVQRAHFGIKALRVFARHCEQSERRPILERDIRKRAQMRSCFAEPFGGIDHRMGAAIRIRETFSKIAR